jgi:protein disulfide-isomerase
VRKEVVVVGEKKAASPPKADEGGRNSRRRTLRAGAEGDDVRAMQVSVVAGLSFWLVFDVCL